MNDQRSPARPWFDLVTEQAAIKGWSMHELSRRSGVGRPTIYRWRDGTETPQARPVGLVADALGIPRERAVRLAGIIAGAERSPPSPSAIDQAFGEDAGRFREAMGRVFGDDAERKLRLVEEALSQLPGDDDPQFGQRARPGPR